MIEDGDSQEFYPMIQEVDNNDNIIAVPNNLGVHDDKFDLFYMSILPHVDSFGNE